MSRPGIFQIGTVRDTGTEIIVSGWGLSPCAGGCHCHYHPDTGRLAIASDEATGSLGLASHDQDCGCCEPWTADELAAIARDLADIDALPA